MTLTILVSRPCIIPWCHALVSRHLCDPMVSRHWDHAMVPCHWYRLRKDFHFSCSNLFLNGKSQSSHLIHFSDPRVGQGGTVTVETTTAPLPPTHPRYASTILLSRSLHSHICCGKDLFCLPWRLFRAYV